MITPLIKSITKICFTCIIIYLGLGMENITQNFGNFSMLKEGVKYIYIFLKFCHK